jgi:hypothetical protein
MKLRIGHKRSARARSQEPDWDRLDDGGIRSVQSTRLSDTGQPSWSAPDGLRQLLRQYFAVLQRCTGPLLRVRWNDSRPSITLRWPPVPLIVMGTPCVEQHATRHAISVPIRGGLLAAPASHAQLSIVVTGETVDLEARVELVGYRPRGDRFILVRRSA